MILLYILIALVVADIATTALKLFLAKGPKYNYRHVMIEVEVGGKTAKEVKMELAKQIIESVQNNTTMINKDNRYIREFLLVDLSSVKS